MMLMNMKKRVMKKKMKNKKKMGIPIFFFYGLTFYNKSHITLKHENNVSLYIIFVSLKRRYII